MRWIENDYAAQLREAGRRRRAGRCIRPGCSRTTREGWLSCGKQECYDWWMAAPADWVRHWQQMIPLADDPLYLVAEAEAEERGDVRELLAVVVLGGIVGAALVIAACAVGIWLGWLRITA